MNRMTNTATKIFLGLILVFTAGAGLKAASEDVTKKSFDAASGGRLVVTTDLGTIDVTSHDRDVVLVEVIRRTEEKSDLERMKLDFHKSGDTVILRGTDLRRGGLFSWITRAKLRVRFRVTVPKAFNLDLRTSGGSIRVGDIQGELVARTSGGSLDFGNVQGSILGRTSGGSIQVGDCSGDVDVDTSGGSITIGSVRGDVEAHTSGGSINIKESFGVIDATTAGGSIIAAIGQQPKRDCVMKTHGGSVRIYLAESIHMDVDARTIGGQVKSAFDVSGGAVSGGIRKVLEGKINGGGPLLSLRTSGGSIYIKKKDW